LSFGDVIIPKDEREETPASGGGDFARLNKPLLYFFVEAGYIISFCC